MIIIDFFKRLLTVSYNPDEHVRPPRRRRKKQSTDKGMSGLKSQVGQAGYDFHGNKLWGPDNTEFGETADIAWEEKSAAGRTDKDMKLSEADVQELERRNANPDMKVKLTQTKAAKIKPLWASGLSIAEISRTLSAHNGEAVRGYGKTVVSHYCAAFTSAVEEEE